MTSKRIIMFLSTVCVFTLVFGFSPKSNAGGDDNGSKNYKTDGVWVVQSLYYGTVITETISSNGDSSGRSTSASANFVLWDPTLGGLYPDAAFVQPPMTIESRKTGRDTYEYTALYYVRNNDGSLAFFWIGRGIGRIIDENTQATSGFLYLYNGENVNLIGMDPNIGPDGMPLDETDLILGGPLPDLAIHKRLNSVLPSLDPPADHFPLP